MIYVDQNRDQLGFNADKVRWLPAEKRHLLKKPDGTSFGERYKACFIAHPIKKMALNWSCLGLGLSYLYLSESASLLAYC